MMTSSPENNYDAWHKQLHNWRSIEDFCSDADVAAGIHRINVGNGPTLDVLIEGTLFNDPYQAIPVFFNGAISERESKSGPFFSGGGLATEADISYVSLSDPSTSLDSSLGLAWYAGNSYSDLPTAIERCLSHIAQVTQRHLLLIGGSGGGFAALNLGCRLGDKASVLAWNPQTNIFRYNSTFSKNYFRHAFGPDIQTHLDSEVWERETQAFLDDRSIRYELCSVSAGRPYRMIIFQNASDWHVQSHAAPLIEAWGFEYRGQGKYQLGREGCLLISDFGKGHEPLPSAVVLKAVLSLMDPACSAEATADSLLRLPELAARDVRTIPRDLRDVVGALEKDLALAVEQVSVDSFRIAVTHNLSPANYGGMSYSFFTVSSAGLISRMPFGPEASVIVDTSAASSVSFGVMIRDGFNNLLLELRNTNTEQEP